MVGRGGNVMTVLGMGPAMLPLLRRPLATLLLMLLLLLSMSRRPLAVLVEEKDVPIVVVPCCALLTASDEGLEERGKEEWL